MMKLKIIFQTRYPYETDRQPLSDFSFNFSKKKYLLIQYLRDNLKQNLNDNFVALCIVSNALNI